MAEHMTFNHGVRSSTLRWVTSGKLPPPNIGDVRRYAKLHTTMAEFGLASERATNADASTAPRGVLVRCFPRHVTASVLLWEKPLFGCGFYRKLHFASGMQEGSASFLSICSAPHPCGETCYFYGRLWAMVCNCPLFFENAVGADFICAISLDKSNEM